jgi:tetratricopeptide (TPR) repeat protein
MPGPNPLQHTAEINRLMYAASAAFARGDSATAARLADQVLVLKPGFPDALHLAGLCAMRGGDIPRALPLLEQAAGLMPENPRLIYNLGVARSESGDRDGALQAFGNAARLAPAHPKSQFNLAVLSAEAGLMEQAETAYRRTLELVPTHAEAAAGLASLFEQRNALEEAERWCEAALTLDAMDPVALLTRGQLHFRAGRYAEAAALLEGLLQSELTVRNRALAAGRLGTAYDRLERPAEAWGMFLAVKQALRQSLPPEPGDGVYSFATAARVARHLDRLLALGSADSTDETPVFLVGFPRSGTTLLDQILSGHPKVAVLEEKDTLQDFLARYALSDGGMEALVAASAATLTEDRRRYWQRVEEYLPERPSDRLFVDKLPLNTLFLPLMARLFPTARFVFSLRDPRDVVLSCFMQTFALNEAMRHFLSIEETVDFYAAVMELGRRSFAAMPGRMHVVRYEGLVADAEGEARSLLEFLGLPWDPAVLDFQATAKRRRINTPSYHQVARPIYGEARERWRRYEEQLKPGMGKLESFVEAFGYK